MAASYFKPGTNRHGIPFRAVFQELDIAGRVSGSFHARSRLRVSVTLEACPTLPPPPTPLRRWRHVTADSTQIPQHKTTPIICICTSLI